MEKVGGLMGKGLKGPHTREETEEVKWKNNELKKTTEQR